MQYASDLENTNFVTKGLPARLNIKWKQNSGMMVETQLPPWDDVTVFLHKLRPLGLQKEKTYFYKVCNLLSKEITHSYFRSLVQPQRDLYGGIVMQSHFKISINEVILNSDKVLFIWLNAQEYHRFEDKQKFLDNLHEFFPLDASKVLFIQLLTDKAVAILNIAKLVRVIFGYEKQIDLPGKEI